MNLDDLKHMTKEDLLGKFGLEPKATFIESFLPAVAIFGAGILCGAAIALMLTPKSGAELRTDLAEGLDSLRNRHASSTSSSLAQTSTTQPRESKV